MPKILSNKYDATQLWLPFDGEEYIFFPHIEEPIVYERGYHPKNNPVWTVDEAMSKQRVFAFPNYNKRITHKQYKHISSCQYPTFDRVDRNDQDSGILKLPFYRYQKRHTGIIEMLDWLENNLRNRFYVNTSKGFVAFETRGDYILTKLAGIMD